MQVVYFRWTHRTDACSFPLREPNDLVPTTPQSCDAKHLYFFWWIPALNVSSSIKMCVIAYRVYPNGASSILSCPFLHAGQCNSRWRTHTAIFGGRCVICAEVTHFDNWSAGFCHFLPFCLGQNPGWAPVQTRSLSSLIPHTTHRLI